MLYALVVISIAERMKNHFNRHVVSLNPRDKLLLFLRNERSPHDIVRLTKHLSYLRISVRFDKLHLRVFSLLRSRCHDIFKSERVRIVENHIAVFHLDEPRVHPIIYRALNRFTLHVKTLCEILFSHSNALLAKIIRIEINFHIVSRRIL